MAKQSGGGVGGWGAVLALVAVLIVFLFVASFVLRLVRLLVFAALAMLAFTLVRRALRGPR